MEHQYVAVTDALDALARQKITHQTTKNILDSLDDKKYDGERLGLRRWYKAVIQTFSSIGIELDEMVKDENFEYYADEDFDEVISESDRTFVYNAVAATLTQQAKDEAEDDARNGHIH
ncbi:hypothetical protein NFJ02_32g81740 [Pycnococcus provasolii]